MSPTLSSPENWLLCDPHELLLGTHRKGRPRLGIATPPNRRCGALGRPDRSGNLCRGALERVPGVHLHPGAGSRLGTADAGSVEVDAVDA